MCVKQSTEFFYIAWYKKRKTNLYSLRYYRGSKRYNYSDISDLYIENNHNSIDKHSLLDIYLHIYLHKCLLKL